MHGGYASGYEQDLFIDVERGVVVGERRFLGLFTAAAYSQSVRAIPFLQRKLRAVLDASGFAPNSHNARDLVQFVETYPRDELFIVPVDELVDVGVLEGVNLVLTWAHAPIFPPQASMREIGACEF